MTIWAQVLDYEDLYRASDEGWVESLDRFVRGRDDSMRWVRGIELTPRVRWDGSFAVNLWRDNRYQQIPVARIIFEAFIGRRPEGMDAYNINGDPVDNRLENLEWQTEKRLREGWPFAVA